MPPPIPQFPNTPHPRRQALKTEMTSPHLDSLTQLFQGLNEAEFAARLGIAPSALSQLVNQPDFERWSQTADPEGVSWRYDEKRQRYFANLSLGGTQSGER